MPYELPSEERSRRRFNGSGDGRTGTTAICADIVHVSIRGSGERLFEVACHQDVFKDSCHRQVLAFIKAEIDR